MSISYSSKKIGYTTGDMFTLTGSSYIGYFNILSGVPYAGRYTQSSILNSKNTYKTDTYISSLMFDRIITDPLTLPYSINKITIPINEVVTSRVLNDSLYKLNFNTLYVYSKLLVYNNSIPQNLTAVIAITSTTDSNLNWYTSDISSISSFSDNSNFSYLGNIVGVKGSYFVDDESSFSLIACTSSSIYALTGSFNTRKVTKIFNSNLIRTDVNNTKTFKNITDFITVDNNLFVIDSGNLSILRYNITELQTLNSYRRCIYVSSAGGNYTGNNVINTPKYLASDYNGHLLIYDSDLGRFIFSDYDFNYIKTVALTQRTETVLKLSYNRFYNLYYILTTKQNALYLYLYTADLVRQDKIMLSDTLLDNEIINSIEFSYNDSNIFYISTNLRIIKKLVNRPAEVVGLFSTENMTFSRNISSANRSSSVGTYTGMSVIASSSNYDLIVLTKQSGLLLSFEPTNFISTLFNQNINNYLTSSIFIDKNQYVQCNYINVELYKILKNIFFIKNQFLGNFTTTYSLSNNSIISVSGIDTTPVLNGYTYLTNYNFLPIQNLNNLFIHENERVSPLAINRSISNIYNLQQLLLQQSLPVPVSIVNYNTADGSLILA